MINYVITILLILCSIDDIRRKKINTNLSKICIIFMFMFQLISKKYGIIRMLIGVIPGIITYVISIVTREGIGKGDAMIIIGLGGFAGLINIIKIYCVALFLCVFIGTIIIIVRKKQIKYKIPFIPMLSLSYILCVLL